MLEKDVLLSTYKVVKRDGKKAPFNEGKIAIAIQKGFESIKNEDDVLKYTKEDINKVFNNVKMKLAVHKEGSHVKIEDIQDLIEETLLEFNYPDVKSSYENYREKRARSRAAFLKSDGKDNGKFLKAIESLGLKSASEDDSKRENANVDGDTAMGTMLQYGSTISKEFAKSYLIDDKFKTGHDSGDIHIHDMDFLPMGTTTCCQINLNKLFKNGFSTGHGFIREPNDIMSYSALAAIAIQANQNDQHGGQSIPAFDYYMAPGVLKTFKKQFKQSVYDLLDYSDILSLVNINKILKEIDKLKTIDFDLEELKFLYKNSKQVEKAFRVGYEKALEKTERRVYQAMEAFIHNLNTMHSRAGAQVPFSAINFGTDTSKEGRMVIKNYLKATEAGLGKGETPIFPISIFKVKEGVNYNKKDPNYDLFKYSCEVSSKRLFPNFAFLDAPFNLKYYDKDNFETEVTYMGCRTRVIANVVDPKKEVVVGRGNLSFSSVNLPRIAIKHGIHKNKEANMDDFYKELEEKLELLKDQLLARFDIQCNKRVYNFPFLLGQGIWIDSEKLKPNDSLKKVLKHGTLTIGFIGLAETLTALTGSHHAQSKESEKLGLEIVQFMKSKIDGFASKHKLNFSLIATPAEGLSGRFVSIDKAIFGEIKGVTDKDYYTNSFHVPVSHEISITKKIKLEAPYHAFTNAGHITYIELDGDASNNVNAFEKVVRQMKEEGIGYGAINHPVDRDTICGFNGVIGDQCPGCGREEGDVPFERIRRITGYLVGTVDRFNDGKKAEEKDRVKHN